MQLPPSTFPIDPSLLTLLMPGVTPGAAPVVPAASGGPATASFAELLPAVGPAEAALDTGFEKPPVMLDAPLGDEQPEVPVLMGQPMSSPRFVAAAPKTSPKKPETPAMPAGPEETATGAGEEASAPVEAKDKASKGAATPKRHVLIEHPDNSKKEPAPELIFSATITAPVVAELPPAPLAASGEEGDFGELPQSQPQLSVSAPTPAKIALHLKLPGTPALITRFAPDAKSEPESSPAPDADSTPAPASPEMPRVPQGATQGKTHSNLPSTSQAPAHSPVWAARTSRAPMPSIPESEVVVPALPDRTPEPALEAPAQIEEPAQTPPFQISRQPQGADHGKPQSSLPPTSRAPEHSPVWALRPLIAPLPVVVPVTEPATTNQPNPISATLPEVAPQSPATAANLPSTPLSAETIEATVAPSVEPVLSLRPEASLPKTDRRERRENFAGPDHEFRVNFEPFENVAQKNFVSTEGERLTPRSKTVGIGVAKPAAIMPPRFSFTPTPHPAFEYAPAVAVASSDRAAQVIEAPVAASAEVASAHQAVEAVLRAVDHVATREQHSVNLHFSVGETDLKVRVELRADEVRTTFSTDSAELRSALSHEWQAVAHGETSGSVRIAPATFTSEHATPAFSGDASSRDRQQHQPAPHGQNEFAQGRAGFGRPASFASADVPPEVRPAARFVHAGSRHLSTLA